MLATRLEKSTVPVQTGMWVERTMKVYNPKNTEFDVASNPEFLREGSAVKDFLHPDRIVIGVQNERSEKILQELYNPVFYIPVIKQRRELSFAEWRFEQVHTDVTVETEIESLQTI